MIYRPNAFGLQGIVIFLLLAAAAGVLCLIGADSFTGKAPQGQTVCLYYYNKAKDIGAGGQIRWHWMQTPAV